MVDAMRDGVRLHVERAGSGPPLLVISGTGGDLSHKPNGFDWRLTGFDVVSSDQRGLGQGDEPEQPSTVADDADDADDAAAVLDAVGRERANVLSVSFGGMAAQELALRHPDRLAPPVNRKRIAARIPGTALAVFDGGHAFLAQDRSAFPAVVDFVTRGS